MTAPQCSGICIYGYELIEGASGVAYAHPDCPLHGDPGWIGCCEHCGCTAENRTGHDDTCRHGCND